MNKILYSFVLSLISFIASCKGECSINCAPYELKDLVNCICVPKLNCADIVSDHYEKCSDEGFPCNNQTMAIQCPKRCFCDEPTILNKYCPICLNGGLRDYKTNGCGCKCFKGFQGPRCQYAKDPCEMNDEPSCSNVDCYNATDKDFFRCQRKCLCCK